MDRGPSRPLRIMPRGMMRWGMTGSTVITGTMTRATTTIPPV